MFVQRKFQSQTNVRDRRMSNCAKQNKERRLQAREAHFATVRKKVSYGNKLQKFSAACNKLSTTTCVTFMKNFMINMIWVLNTGNKCMDILDTFMQSGAYLRLRSAIESNELAKNCAGFVAFIRMISKIACVSIIHAKKIFTWKMISFIVPQIQVRVLFLFLYIIWIVDSAFILYRLTVHVYWNVL